MNLRPWWTISLLCCVTCSATLRSGSGDARRPFTELEDVPGLAGALETSKAGFWASHSVALENSLGYAPKSAARLDLIQNSAYKMDEVELPMFEKSGFVVSERQTYSSFAFGYLDLFKADLPVYVTADAILHAWHRSYDELLIEMEKQLIVPMLDEFLDRLRKRLASGGPGNPLRAELDEYLTVAHSLLKQKVLEPAAGGNPNTVACDVASATAASGSIKVFGENRATDLTQFKPRGHYEKHPELQPYFRAMMWLGRIDFRFLQSKSDGSQCLNKEQVEEAVWIRELMDARSLELY